MTDPSAPRSGSRQDFERGLDAFIRFCCNLFLAHRQLFGKELFFDDVDGHIDIKPDLFAECRLV